MRRQLTKYACLSVLAVPLLTACATHDARDRYLLGAANAANIAAQSVRDVNVPNSTEVQSSSGMRAANAVRALNEGKRKELPGTTASSGNGGGAS